jgi:putative membrane protein
MSKTAKTKRAPRAFAPDDPKIVVREKDIAEAELAELESLAPPDHGLRVPATGAITRGIKWGGILLGALGSLAALGTGLWFSSMVSDLFVRQDWIGWTSLGLLGLAAFAFLMIALREAWALMRLRRLGGLRQDAESAERNDDKGLARRVATDLKQLYRGRADLAWGRARLGDHERDIMSARETLTLCERELIAPIDTQARTLVAGTAKRVSVITAISPAAVLDMAVVAAQNMRMLRRIATLYGARPGMFGLFKLARMVLAHIVLTGGIALGDDLIQQMIGHKLMAKLSARLGEGLFNGALTARIGLAAIDVCRPLPFIEVKPPRLRTLLGEIARQAAPKS